MSKNKMILMGVAIVLCILLLVGALGFDQYDKMKDPYEAFEKDLQQQEKSEEMAGDTIEGEASEENVINLLLLGVDSTEVREAKKMGYRSDAIMVVSIDLDHKKVKMVSIPRDSYTEIPGNRNKDKINHAMAFGGGPKEKGNQYAVEAVEGLLGIDIHYYVTMDLDTIKDIVDIMGGVTIDVERNMGSGEGRILKGTQNLNGQQALTYLSNRSVPTGDFARIQQQQKFMMALFQQAKEKGKLSDIIPLYLKVQSKIFTDLKIEQIGALALFFKDLNPKDIETFTLRGRHMMIDDIYYLDVDQDYIKEIFN